MAQGNLLEPHRAEISPCSTLKEAVDRSAVRGSGAATCGLTVTSRIEGITPSPRTNLSSVLLGVFDNVLHGETRSGRIPRFDRLEYGSVERQRISLAARIGDADRKVGSQRHRDDLSQRGEKRITGCRHDVAMKPDIGIDEGHSVVDGNLHLRI